MKNIRNFCIISHVDHGKSTLADRLLEITKTIPKEDIGEQFLDQMDLEKERGITIKLQPVQMHYFWHGENYTLNLIDTPGHVDFSYEVTRSLAAVEGTILLIDATQGIQAQTLSNATLAKNQGLTIIPVINKIDLPNAQIEKVLADLTEAFGFKEEDVLRISAKLGTNVEDLIGKIIAKIPPPVAAEEKPLRALIFDSHFDSFKGVLAYVRLIEGKVGSPESLILLGTKQPFTASEVGIFTPTLKPCPELVSGDIGYVATGLKDVSQVRVGDTLASKEGTEPLPGYKEIKPFVYAGIYPINSSDFEKLREALGKLKLNDAALAFSPEFSNALGPGFRCGFLGVLHLEIVQERLEREFNLSLIASAPTVKYKIIKTTSDEEIIESPSEFPEPQKIKTVFEPWVSATIITPVFYLGGLLELLNKRRGEVENLEYISDKVKISARLPLNEIIFEFYDRLKSISAGFASLDYDFAGWKETEVVKLEILVSGEAVDALSQIVVKEKAYELGKKLVENLRNAIPKQQFEVSLQASIGGKIIARDNVKAFRKDVLAKIYGGHRERKDKLLEAQKKGKKRMKMVGRIEIPQEAFLSVLKI